MIDQLYYPSEDQLYYPSEDFDPIAWDWNDIKPDYESMMVYACFMPTFLCWT